MRSCISWTTSVFFVFLRAPSWISFFWALVDNPSIGFRQVLLRMSVLGSFWTGTGFRKDAPDSPPTRRIRCTVPDALPLPNDAESILHGSHRPLEGGLLRAGLLKPCHGCDKFSVCLPVIGSRLAGSAENWLVFCGCCSWLPSSSALPC